MPAGASKLPVTLGLAVGFAGYSVFLYHLQLANHDLAAIWHKSDEKNNIPNAIFRASGVHELT